MRQKDIQPSMVGTQYVTFAIPKISYLIVLIWTETKYEGVVISTIEIYGLTWQI